MGHSEHKALTDCAPCAREACPPCETHTPLRNNYFFGKLMDVPDFDVEQLYVVDKFRRHHARLHGSGVVCGLEVVAHANPACRDRYIVVKPGSALDCCGNEILVLDEEILDIRAFPKVAELFEKPDDKDHVLQVCVRYRECPTEEVPVLYDECGCDDTRCAPNRILETYAFDILVDPKLPDPAAPHMPELERIGTIVLAGAKAIVVHHASARLYVAADQSPTGGIIQQYDLPSQAPLAPRAFADRVAAIAASVDGTRLYAAVSGATAADPAQLHRLDTTSAAAFSTGATDAVDIPNSDAAHSVRLLTLPSGVVASLTVKGGQSFLQMWDVSGAALTPFAGKSLTVASVLVDWSLGSDGRLYAAEASATVRHYDPAVNGLDPKSIAVTSSGVVGFAIGKSTAPDVFAWIEGAGKALRLAKLDGTALASVTLPETPVAFVVDPHAHFAYVLQQPATGSALAQPVDLHRMLSGTGNPLGAAVPVGPAGVALALDERLFAAYADGVAVLAIEHDACGDYLLPHACPHCDTPDCIVLATIQNYRPGFLLENVTTPPSDPMADKTAKIARLDNLLGRVVVPSVADLAKAVLCLLEQPGGGAGGQGPPGKDGKDGKDGVDGQDGADGQDGQDGINGQDGKDGVGLDWDLPHICDFNWTHDPPNPLPFPSLRRLIVTFDTRMRATDLDIDTIIVSVERDEGDVVPLRCWCDLDLRDRIELGRTQTKCEARSGFIPGIDGAGFVTAVRINLTDELRRFADREGLLRLRVIIKGDFIRGAYKGDIENLRALDADHLPKVDPPSPPGPPQPGVVPQWMVSGDGRFSGDGVEGGTFESWFTVRFG